LFGSLDVKPDLVSLLGLWWCEKSMSLQGGEAGLRLETMSDPGWMLQVIGFNDIAISEAFGDLPLGPPGEWMKIEQRSDAILIMAGPFQLAQILWRFLGGSSGTPSYFGKPPEVPRHYHGMHIEEGLLDLAQRLQKWFICNCDYYWEEEFGFKVCTEGNSMWRLEIDSGNVNELHADDYRVLNGTTATTKLDFKKSGRNLVCSCTNNQFTEMVARAMEFVEGDWKDLITN
jgi:hypothetical protein